MGFHYSVKICINHRMDHYTSGVANYRAFEDKLTNTDFDPFYACDIHTCISHNWRMNMSKIKEITFIFIKRKGNIRNVPKIISLKVDNCKVTNISKLCANLKFIYNDPQYANLRNIKLFG